MGGDFIYIILYIGGKKTNNICKLKYRDLIK